MSAVQVAEVVRTSGAGWSIRASRVHHGDVLHQYAGPSEARFHGSTYRVIGEPMRTGYCQGFVRVAEVGGHHDGNTFGMHYSLARVQS